MFEQLYKYPAIVADHRRAPMAEERARFLEHMAAKGYPRHALVNFASGIRRVIDALHFESGASISLEKVKRIAAQIAPEPGARRGPQESFVTVARHWLRFTGSLKAEEPLAHESMIRRFQTWMADERGLSRDTIKNRGWHLRHFFRWLSARGRRPISKISLRDIDGFLQWSGEHGWTRRSVSARAYALRAFFLFAGTAGWCRSSIGPAIQGPRHYTDETLPVGPRWNDVRRLLATTDTAQPRDIRDRAILLLLAVYGLRRSEVAGLRLDDIDWENNQIKVRRPKVREAHAYPLVPIVGHAIIRYLREVRPRCERRELFLTLKAPTGPVSHLYNMVRKRLAALGIESAHRGPHALRHACAAQLLSRGLSLKEIGDHLGHRSLQSTRTYAKVDLAGLGEVAAFDLGGVA